MDWAFTLCELGRCSEAGKLPVGDQSLGGYILAKCYLADGGAGWGQAAIGPTVELMRSDNRWKDDQALAVLYVDALWTLYSLEPDAELLQEMLSVYEQAKESMLPGLLDPTGPEPRRLSYMARLTEDLETAEKVERALLEMGLPTADSVINGMILTYADQPGVSVIDVESRLRQRSANGIVGYNFLLDYCHPNFDGAMTIALMLAAEIESRELAGTPDDAVDMEQLAARIREGFWKRGFDETDVRYFTGVGPWPVMLYNPNPPLSWRARQAREVVAAGDADPLTDLYAAYADLFDNQYSVEDVEGRLIPRIRGIAEADPSIPGLRTSMAWLALSVGDAQRAIEILWEEDAALDPEAGRRMIRWINDAP